MTTSHRVVVVAPTPDVARVAVESLVSAGHVAILVSDFADAKAELDGCPPDLLVTELKLGAYNGLHLAIRAQARGAATKTIVLGDPEPVLEAEAARRNVRYLTLPLEEQTFLAAVTELLPQSNRLVAPDILTDPVRLPKATAS